MARARQAGGSGPSPPREAPGVQANAYSCARNRVTFHKANVLQRGCSAVVVGDDQVSSPGLLQHLRATRSLILLGESPLRFALALRQLLQVHSQKPLPSPAGKSHAQPLERSLASYKKLVLPLEFLSGQPRESFLCRLGLLQSGREMS